MAIPHEQIPTTNSDTEPLSGAGGWWKAPPPVCDARPDDEKGGDMRGGDIAGESSRPVNRGVWFYGP